MKPLLAVALFLLAIGAGLESRGQDSASKFTIYVSPALFVPVTVAAQVGWQYKWSKQWAVLAEVGIPAVKNTDAQYEKLNFVRLTAEAKYFSKKKQKSGGYYSLHTGVLFRKLVINQSEYYTKTGQYAYQNAVINSPVFSMALKLGQQLPISKHVVADIFVGAGVRLLFTKYNATGVTLSSNSRPADFGFGPSYGWVYNYTLARVHLTAGIRVGFAF